MNTITKIEELQAEMQRTRERVLVLTGIRENDLSDMILDSGEEWLKLITHNDARALQYIPRTREFWGFWRKTWHNLDLAFLDCSERCNLNRYQAETFYHFTHRITADNSNVLNSRVQAHYHMLRSMITFEKH